MRKEFIGGIFILSFIFMTLVIEAFVPTQVSLRDPFEKFIKGIIKMEIPLYPFKEFLMYNESKLIREFCGKHLCLKIRGSGSSILIENSESDVAYGIIAYRTKEGIHDFNVEVIERDNIVILEVNAIGTRIKIKVNPKILKNIDLKLKGVYSKINLKDLSNVTVILNISGTFFSAHIDYSFIENTIFNINAKSSFFKIRFSLSKEKPVFISASSRSSFVNIDVKGLKGMRLSEGNIDIGKKGGLIIIIETSNSFGSVNVEW